MESLTVSDPKTTFSSQSERDLHADQSQCQEGSQHHQRPRTGMALSPATNRWNGVGRLSLCPTPYVSIRKALGIKESSQNLSSLPFFNASISLPCIYACVYMHVCIFVFVYKHVYFMCVCSVYRHACVHIYACMYIGCICV